jgi:hypothetical protein
MKSIGITLKMKSLNNVWANGLHQNIISLYKLLSKTGAYDVSFILDHLSSEKEDFIKTQEQQEDKMVSIFDVMDGTVTFDIILEAAVSFSDRHIEKMKSDNKDMKMISVLYGNPYITDMEKLLFNHDETKQFSLIKDYHSKRDEYWISPHFQISKGYLETLTKAPVRICPYIWSPEFLEKELDYYEKRDGHRNVYDQNKIKSVAVLEPNLNIVKTSIIPALVAEQLYCDEKRQIPEKTYLFGTDIIKERKEAISLLGHLEITKDKRMFFEGRYRFLHIFKSHAGTLLCHHFHNGLNYVYLEALYLGLPLVHNSEFLQGAGYYYDGFDIKDGARALKEAITTHDSRREEYQKTANQFIWQYSPENPININGYVELVEGLFPNYLRS